MKIIFFGTSPLAEHVLPELDAHNIPIALIVAGQDIPVRKSNDTRPPPEKVWAIEHHIPYVQPTSLDTDFIAYLKEQSADCFVVASYGRILPQALLEIPPRGVVNLHPSLLPRLRGPSPMRSALLHNETRVGVSIMLLDAEMDHGPLLAQKIIATPTWPLPGRALDTLLGKAGATLLAETLPAWVAGTIQPKEQHHAEATYCRMFKKTDGEIDLVQGDAHENFRKISAFDGWPGTYAFVECRGTRIRLIITRAHMEGNNLILDTVIPEGKKEMSYQDFLRGKK